MPPAAARAPRGPAVAIPGAGKVAIYRDGWGVPHILAAREADGFYGLGYSTGEDQAARFYLTVLLARGTLAATVAPDDLSPPLRALLPSVDAMIESDYHARLWGVRAASVAAVALLYPSLRRDYTAFLAGLEAFARDHPDQIPIWHPRDISVADVVAMTHVGLWDAYEGGIAVDDCARGGAPMAPVIAGKPPSGYSNEWALAPRRTSTGGAILLSDPHGGMDGRFSHEFTMQAGGLHTAGMALGPVMIIGRNAYLGWGLTTGSPDVADCYAIAPTPADPATYLYDGQPRRIETSQIAIPVKGRAPLVVNARYAVVNGIRSPVIAEREGRLYVAVTPYLGNLAGLHNSVYRMNQANTTDAFYAALATGGMFPQNLLAADTRGELLFVHAGLTPIRSDAAVDWTRPVSGNDSRFAWKGIHPLSDLVVIHSPRAGYIENNNTDPRFMDTAPPPETIGKAEYLLTDGSLPTSGPSTRATLFLDAMAGRQRFSEADALAIAFDVGTYAWAAWHALLRASLDQHALGGRAKPFADDLLVFDGRLDRGSTGALKYVFWREALRGVLAGDDGHVLADVVLHGAPAPPALRGKVMAAVQIAADRLATTMPRGLDATYGDMFKLSAGDALLPMSGGSLKDGAAAKGRPLDCDASPLLCPETLMAVRYRREDAQTRVAYGGTRIMRLDFLSPRGIRSFSYQNPGESDDPSSIHSVDQAERLVSKQRLKPILFDLDQLRGEVVSAEVLLVRSPRP